MVDFITNFYVFMRNPGHVVEFSLFISISWNFLKITSRVLWSICFNWMLFRVKGPLSTLFPSIPQFPGRSTGILLNLIAVLKGRGVQFDTLWHQILYRLHLVLKIEIEGWNFTCSIKLWSSTWITKKIWDRMSLTSIFNSMKLENAGKYHFFHSNSIILSY